MGILVFISSLVISAHAQNLNCELLINKDVPSFDMTVNIRGKVYLAHQLGNFDLREQDGSHTGIYQVQLSNGQTYGAQSVQVNFRSRDNFYRPVVVNVESVRPKKITLLGFTFKGQETVRTPTPARILSEKIQAIPDADGSVDRFRVYDVQFSDGVIARYPEHLVEFP